MGDGWAVIGFNITKGIRNKNTNWVFVVGFFGLPSDVTYYYCWFIPKYGQRTGMFLFGVFAVQYTNPTVKIKQSMLISN